MPSDTAQDTTLPQDTSPAQDAPQAGGPPRVEIAGMFFDLPLAYSEGHVLTLPEAVALDQVRRENIRNIFAKTVKKAEAVPAGPEKDSALRAKFAELVASYSFTRTAVASALDPVEKMALEIATEALNAALTKSGMKKSNLAPGVFDAKVQEILASKPAITEEAKSRIASQQRLASGLEGISL